MFFVLVLLTVPILGCPTCVGRVNKTSQPFFTSEFDTAQKNDQPPVIFSQSQEEDKEGKS